MLRVHDYGIFKVDGGIDGIKIGNSVELPSIGYVTTALQVIAAAESFSNLARMDGIKFGYRSGNCETLAELYENSRGEGFEYDIKRQIITGAIVLSRDNRHLYYDRAIRARAKICAELDEVFQKYDVIITSLDSPMVEVANLSGCPAIALHGKQIIAPKFGEEILFKVARTIEIAGGGGNE